MVEFRERPVIDARDMGRALILKITVELDSQAASMGGTTKMRFYAHTTVAEALRMIGTRYPVKSMREYGLFIPEQRGTEAYWLERSATIASYDLTHHTDIVYKRMLKPFTIAFPSGERELFRVGDDTLVGDMMEAIRDIFPVPDIGVYGLFLPLPHPIPLMKLYETLWSYKSLKVPFFFSFVGGVGLLPSHLPLLSVLKLTLNLASPFDTHSRAHTCCSGRRGNRAEVEGPAGGGGDGHGGN